MNDLGHALRQHPHCRFGTLFPKAIESIGHVEDVEVVKNMFRGLGLIVVLSSRVSDSAGGNIKTRKRTLEPTAQSQLVEPCGTQQCCLHRVNLANSRQEPVVFVVRLSEPFQRRGELDASPFNQQTS